MGIIRDLIFLFLFFVLVVAWLIAWAMMHVTAGAIHILLVVAVVCLLLHLISPRQTV